MSWPYFGWPRNAPERRVAIKLHLLCTEAVAVSYAFRRVNNEARTNFVLLGATPTGRSPL
ncbi:hypothetical protein [Hydrogenophaga sp. PAMC20947]|uniref:hypothetical protein n=1 Tax=Hydrogenophaga sp. PAMC20947 TaxID=2565558 RepID=UPI001FF9786F|nr:hypothetical protein [Hydrogenophaga sp. PAMC20947]